MADLVVDTGLLRAAAAELTAVAETADRLGNGHARLGEVVWAAGSHRAGQGLDSFLCEWTYGVRCVASQAGAIANDLTRAAVAYGSVEAMLAAAASGGGVAPHVDVPTLAPTRYEEPLRPARRMLDSPGALVQLSEATHATQLIPGDPEQVAMAGRMLTRFADELSDAQVYLRRVSLGAWVGAAARALTGELEQVGTRLRTADVAFADAASAVGAYARVHGDAQADAARALAMWQAAEAASAAARGAVVGAAPIGGPADPEAEMARAAALLRDARERFETAARALAEVLARAEIGAPDDPGLFARIGRVITSFSTGVAEGVWGIGEGAVVLAVLAVKLNPARALWDPHGSNAAYEALGRGLEYAAKNPGAVGKALLDVDTFREDPARWFGRLVPDLIGIGLTAGAAGVARGTAAGNRLRSAADVIEQARAAGRAVFEPVDNALARRRLGELRLDPASAAGRAVRKQLNPPFGEGDHWVPVRLRPGDRVLVHPDGFVTPLGNHLPTDARALFEDLQVPPMRDRLPDGSVSDPTYPAQAQVYEVGGDSFDAASATALANPQFGAGGGSRLAVGDLQTAVSDGRLAPSGVHDFDPDTLGARIEDPRYQQVDPDLPDRPLDPTHEQRIGTVRGGAEEAAETARGMAVTTAATSALDQIEQGQP